MPIDYNNYPPDWLSEIRPRIMERANNRCEVCGLKHMTYVFSIQIKIRHSKNDWRKRSVWFRSRQDARRESMDGKVKRVRVVLTIAHLDHDESNHEVKDDRLKAMCQLCHLRYDVTEKKVRKQSKQKEFPTLLEWQSKSRVIH